MLQTHIIDHNNDEVKRILSENPELASKTFGHPSYAYPLQVAIRAQNIIAAGIIISYGQKDINILERYFFRNFTIYELSALEEACLLKNEEMVDFLLSMYPGDEKSLLKEIKKSDLFDNLFFDQFESSYRKLDRQWMFEHIVFPKLLQKDSRKVLHFIYDNIETPLLFFFLEFLSPLQVKFLFHKFNTHALWAFILLKKKRAEERIGSIFAKHLLVKDLPIEICEKISLYFDVDLKLHDF